MADNFLILPTINMKLNKMDKHKEFKFIKGSYVTGAPADICFYTDVDYWSVKDFLWEFDYLVNNVCPSKIRIHINSVGGSVVEGMSVFTKICDCAIPTETINDALAASMGSIIWAAGDELFMKDYALLMIHNPFCDSCGEKQQNQVTEAFAKQLKTIYMKRFGLDEEAVANIMDGKEGEDGTFLTAQDAMERGFIRSDHIIETPKAVKSRIQAAIGDVTDINRIKAVYGLVASAPIPGVNNKSKIKSKKMEDNQTAVFAALFGLTGDKATVENVTARINDAKSAAAKAEAAINDMKAKLDASQNEVTRLKAELTGAQTSVKNLTADLDDAKSKLKSYEDAERKAMEDKVNALIDKAVDECKINKDEREIYIKMARNDYEMAVNVLAKIPSRDKISQSVASANEVQAKEGVKTDLQRIEDKVNALVGGDFKFRTLG